MKKILLILVCSVSTALATVPEYLTYEEFIQQVEAGNVQSVKISEYSHINGTYTVEGQQKKFHSFGDTGTANDPLINRLLDAHEVEVVFEETDETFSNAFTTISGCMFIIFPIAMLIMLAIMLKKLNKLLKLLQPGHTSDDHLPLDDDSTV